MGTLALSRYALTVSAATALLAGCGASQADINSALARRVTPATQLHKKPNSRSGSELLYAATSHGILMLTYPTEQQVGTLPTQDREPYICSDPNTGSVFVAESGVINEYAHGGTSIIQTLTPPSSYVNLSGCSVDPTNGNLAVAAANTSGLGAILIYAAAHGSATLYSDPALLYYYYCAYNNQGDLFVTGAGNKKHQIVPKYAELQKGSRDLTNITLNEDVGFSWKVQWDGTYWALKNVVAVNQVAVSGSNGTVVGTAQLNDAYGDAPAFWIQGSTVIARYGKPLKKNNQRLAYWNYPAGGEATKVLTGLTHGKKDLLMDLTVSLVPSRLGLHH